MRRPIRDETGAAGAGCCQRNGERDVGRGRVAPRGAAGRWRSWGPGYRSRGEGTPECCRGGCPVEGGSEEVPVRPGCTVGRTGMAHGLSSSGCTGRSGVPGGSCLGSSRYHSTAQECCPIPGTHRQHSPTAPRPAARPLRHRRPRRSFVFSPSHQVSPAERHRRRPPGRSRPIHATRGEAGGDTGRLRTTPPGRLPPLLRRLMAADRAGSPGQSFKWSGAEPLLAFLFHSDHQTHPTFPISESSQ